MLPAELRLYRGPEGEADVDDAGWLWHIHHLFHKGFERMREAYSGVLAAALHHRTIVVVCFVLGSYMIRPRCPWLIGSSFADG